MEIPKSSIEQADNSKTIQVHNPSNGEVIGSVPHCDAGDVDTAVNMAYADCKGWASRDPVDRGKVLYHAAELIRIKQEELARLLTTEQGKPLKESRNEIAGFSRVLEYYASIAGGLKGDYGNSSIYGHAIVSRQPLGVCGAIIPWNMPALIMAWKVGPALTAGNAIIVKPASSTPFTCLALASELKNAGVPEQILQVITGSGEVVGEAIATHPQIRAVSFTGSSETGRRVASLAAPLFKRVTLELGGSDPMIVCKDADLNDAVKGAVAGRFYNCGQTCTAIKRLFVDESIAEPFMQKATELIRKLRIGSGLESGIDLGPVHSYKQREHLIDQISRTVNGEFGTVLTGGSCPGNPDLKGCYFEPTVIADIAPGAPVMREEVFGPVLPIMSFKSLDDAIEEANSTRYGLGASIWTHDSRIISKACKELEAGIVWVNQHLKIPPEVPFGGTKDSGIGRENGRYALNQYLEEKTILIRP